jgi:hypothetical protein
MNTYINPTDTQRRLDIFSNVKAATVLPAVETNINDSDEQETKADLSKVSILSYSLFIKYLSKIFKF